MSTLKNIDQDTIAAIATPVGSSGIGIIRISGKEAVSIAKALFKPSSTVGDFSGPCLIDQLPSHYLKHGFICDDSNRTIIDEVLLAIMRRPHSYTCEDVVEIQSHCGPVILNNILKMALARGARLAEPGEFTKRAFLNGRIDLSQAEAVADMISARSEDALKLAASHLTGAMKDAVLSMIDFITGLQASLEASLEFHDEVGDPFVDLQEILPSIYEALIAPITQFVLHYREGHLLRDGIRLSITGRPNVGKSSLLNFLVRKERAIVTPIPGTTRDLIEDHITVAGLPVIVTDTAGLHDSRDPVEIIGIRKTREHITESDLALFMIDGQQPFLNADLCAYEHVKGRNAIVVVNKIDLVPFPDTILVPEPYSQHPIVFISAKHGHGIELLKETIRQRCLGQIAIEPGRTIVPNLRQKQLFDLAIETLNRVCSGIENRAGEELILTDLNLVKETLNEIVGNSNNSDLLDEIFRRFCIGK